MVTTQKIWSTQYEEEEKITPQMMFEAEMIVRAQTQNLVQGINTPIPTMFPDADGGEGVKGLSYYKNQKIVSWSYVSISAIWGGLSWQGRLCVTGRIFSVNGVDFWQKGYIGWIKHNREDCQHKQRGFLVKWGGLNGLGYIYD